MTENEESNHDSLMRLMKDKLFNHVRLFEQTGFTRDMIASHMLGQAIYFLKLGQSENDAIISTVEELLIKFDEFKASSH